MESVQPVFLCNKYYGSFCKAEDEISNVVNYKKINKNLLSITKKRYCTKETYYEKFQIFVKNCS